MAELPQASLIVCSRNRPDLLEETVGSVLRGDELPAELVIVDQSHVPHPTLGARGRDERCEVRYFWGRSAGVSRARNAGVALARHPLLAFLDDDMRVARDWFAVLVRALAEAGPGTAVTGRVLEEAEAGSPGGFAPSTTTGAEPVVYAGRPARDVLYTGNMALHRSALEAAGPFDERLGPGTEFPAAEDNDLGFRLLEAGFRIAYCPGAVAWHRAWRGERDLLPLRWGYGRGQGAYYAKHAALRDPYMLGRFGADLGRLALRLPRRIVRHPRRAAGDVVFAAGLCAGAGRWLWTRPKAR